MVGTTLIQVYSWQPRMLRKADSNTVPCEYFEIYDNSYPNRGTTLTSFPLSYHVDCAAIPHQYTY